MTSLYQPLQEDQIRLLRIDSRSSPSKIICHLSLASLSSIPTPEFKTLSYTWGNEDNSKNIIVNNSTVWIRPNLADALAAMHYPNRPGHNWNPDIPWWIDSLCIDQNNMDEQGRQVAMMGDIFHKSKQTVAWLGRKSRDSLRALVFLNRLGQSESVEQAWKIAKQAKRRDWKAMEELFRISWWSRAWTLQEYVIPKNRNYIFLCGDTTMGRDDFEAAVYFLNKDALWEIGKENSSLFDQKGWKMAFKRRKIRIAFECEEKIPLFDILVYAGGSAASDKRDCVFSLMGLSADNPQLGAFDFSPNYLGGRNDKTANETFIRLVRAQIGMTGSLDAICFGATINRPANFPSWVPYWPNHDSKANDSMAWQSFQGLVRGEKKRDEEQSRAYYRAAGSHKYFVGQHTDNPALLSCVGICLGIVDGLGGCFVDGKRAKAEGLDCEATPSTSLLNCQRPSVERGCASDEVWRILVLNRKDYHLDSPAPPQYRERFQQFCRDATIDVRLQQWLDCNSSLLVNGQNLVKSFHDAARSASPTASGLRRDKLSEEWDFEDQLLHVWRNMEKRLMTTENGLIGMAPIRASKGDKICVLFGCSVLVALRYTDQGTHEFIGECYLDRFMDGEATTDNTDKVQTFLLC